MSKWTWLPLAGLAAAAIACIDGSIYTECTAGNKNCDCRKLDLCSEGLQCIDGLCVEVFDTFALSESSEGEAEPDPVLDLPADEPTEPACVSGDYGCEGDELLVCEGGQWSAHGCTDLCYEIGYASVGCEDDQCVCAGPLDQECELGVYAYCTCAGFEFGFACGFDTADQLYAACWQGEAEAETIRCYAGYVDDLGVDCLAAFVACG